MPTHGDHRFSPNLVAYVALVRAMVHSFLGFVLRDHQTVITAGSLCAHLERRSELVRLKIAAYGLPQGFNPGKLLRQSNDVLLPSDAEVRGL